MSESGQIHTELICSMITSRHIRANAQAVTPTLPYLTLPYPSSSGLAPNTLLHLSTISPVLPDLSGHYVP